MLKISKRLRKYAIQRWGMKGTPSDSEIRVLLARKQMAGKITVERIAELNTPVKSAKSGGGTATKVKKKSAAPPAKKKLKSKKTGMNTKSVGERVDTLVAAALKKAGIGAKGAATDLNPATAFTKAVRIRVKEAADQYSTTKKGAVYPMVRKAGGGVSPHPFGGQPAKFGETLLDHPSDRDKAVALAFVRFQATKSARGKGIELPRWLRMTPHDHELVMYAAHNEKWVGRMGDEDEGVAVVKRKKLNDFQIKTLLDDSVSGGIEITPVVFDDALILTPILYGELFPFVNVQTIARGRRVKGGSIVNPTFTSGIGEGTAIQPFNTASFVSAFDTAVYPAVAAIELGQDFEEDSPVDLGGQIVEQFGLKALEWLDRVIAVGNGFNEPQGFFNAVGATNVNSVFGAGGPLTVSDMEGLMFGVPKQFRGEPGATLAYVSNDYTYRKTRSIPVGPGDQRRVFGMNHAAYELLDTQYKVQNDIPDGYAAYINLRRYRMYRRLGMQVRIETGGRQLALSNTRLIVVRMRYGGQLELGGAAALMKDAQVM